METTLSEVRQSLDYNRRYDLLRDKYWNELDQFLDEEAAKKVNQFAEREVLKKKLCTQKELNEYGWGEFIDERTMIEVKLFKIETILDYNLDIG